MCDFKTWYLTTRVFSPLSIALCFPHWILLLSFCSIKISLLQWEDGIDGLLSVLVTFKATFLNRVKLSFTYMLDIHVLGFPWTLWFPFAFLGDTFEPDFAPQSLHRSDWITKLNWSKCTSLPEHAGGWVLQKAPTVLMKPCPPTPLFSQSSSPSPWVTVAKLQPRPVRPCKLGPERLAVWVTAPPSQHFHSKEFWLLWLFYLGHKMFPNPQSGSLLRKGEPSWGEKSRVEQRRLFEGGGCGWAPIGSMVSLWSRIKG